MAIQFINKESQAVGMFDNGKIRENKPIGFLHDNGKLKPYSNLFYWANAWSEEGGIISLHPHRGFEIISVVIDGTISHFDTSINKWLDLNEGEVQIIRAGSGISHAEKLAKQSRMFQIWFDPDLQKTWDKPASYDVYHPEQFRIITEKESIIKILKKGNGPITMDSSGTEIYDIRYKKGKHLFRMEQDAYYSFYLIDGLLNLEGKQVNKDGFFVVQDEDMVEMEIIEDSRMFVIVNPKLLNFKTYAELNY